MELPADMIMRSLELQDFDKGYIQLLSQLTVTGDITKEQFKKAFEYQQSQKCHYTSVIEYKGTIVASGSILIEQKFIRGCGKVGHIEDVVVSDQVRGRSLGKYVIEEMTRLGRENGCYKTILCCSDKNQGFYEKCGYTKKEIEMVRYF